MSSTGSKRNRRSHNTQASAGDKPGLKARQAAHRILGAILDAGSSMDGLTDEDHGHPQYLALDSRDRALVRAILLTTLRNYGDLEAAVAGFTDKPLPAGATGVRNILLAGLAQILFLDVPDRSAVDLAVSAAQGDPRGRRFANLVNALLRRASREREDLLSRFATSPVRAPAWFAERLDEIFGPAKGEAIDRLHRTEAPVDITLKRAEQPRIAEWAERLGAAILPTGSLRLRQRGSAISGMDGYDDGAWWVQDAAAALPAKLFGDIGGKRVADLCAAPGGKTAQLADAGADVTALDLSKNRLKRLDANMERLGLGDRCTTVAADLLAFTPEKPFDAVLLDAPCSSTGTVRRHPDIPFTKSMADVEKLADLQARMLDHAAKLVAPGGLLVFSNCSIDPLEGEDVAGRFAAGSEDYALEPVTKDEVPGLEHTLTAEGYLRITPADLPAGDDYSAGIDGFFAARFRKRG